jgi:Protein of unknown function (DUF3995)
VLALLSAIPSFYWAAGGTIGLDSVGGAIEELARARDPAGVALGIGAGVLKVAGAVLALALVRPAGPVDRTALRWHVPLWDLWFLVWGLVLGVAVWHYGRQSSDRGAR